MAIYRMDDNSFVPVAETTFATAGLREREDIQRRIRADVSILAPDVMVVAEEFADWSDSSRRVDVRCVRLKPYKLADGTLLVDAQQIIPLPEASEYLTKSGNRILAG